MALTSVAKRIIDIAVAGATLLFAAPALVLVALAIKLDSPGPVFYVAKRCGIAGTRFDFYKFRTMVPGAQRGGSRILTGASDPRVTRVGRYLRAFKIDEVPQMLNVLQGHMSIVGPRPEPPDVVERYYPERWAEILTVKPGLTCLLQVEVYPDFSAHHANVGDTEAHYVAEDLPLKLERDLVYVRRASLWLDAQIVARTAYCILVKSWAHVGRSTRGPEVRT